MKPQTILRPGAMKTGNFYIMFTKIPIIIIRKFALIFCMQNNELKMTFPDRLPLAIPDLRKIIMPDIGSVKIRQVRNNAAGSIKFAVKLPNL